MVQGGTSALGVTVEDDAVECAADWGDGSLILDILVVVAAISLAISPRCHLLKALISFSEPDHYA